MGVTGLWKLIESCGKPVAFETLEDKIIVIDISIWLHQVVKGYTDGKGGHIHNSHLLGLFNRICKLLYFRIKPIFIFDGKACQLKYETLHKRAQQKSKIKSESEKIEGLLLQSLAKEKIIKEALNLDTKNLTTVSPIKKKPVIEKDDIFKLPLGVDSEKLSMKLEEETREYSSPKKSYNLNIQSIDVESSYFKSLAPDIRHDILVDIKETRKQNTWAKLRDLPVESQDFSSYQMDGLLKRRKVQMSLEEAEKEMGGKVFSLSELESLLAEDGVLEVGEKYAQTIASNENSRFLLVRDIKKAIDDAKNKQLVKEEPQPSTSKSIKQENEDDYDLELQKAIQMSLGNEPDETSIKLSAQQRKKFVGSFQSHGLVKGFMKEYGEMNDNDIKELINATQVENDTSHDESLTQQFPNTDKYVLYSTPEKSKEPEEPDTKSTEKKEIVITIDSESYNQTDDIFADLFLEPKVQEVTKPSESVLDVEIASISDDDDTIEYEISDSEEFQSCEILSQKSFEKLAVSEPESPKHQIVDESSESKSNDALYSESDKFWSQVDDIEKEHTANEKQHLLENTPEKKDFSLTDIESNRNTKEIEIASKEQIEDLTEKSPQKLIDEIVIEAEQDSIKEQVPEVTQSPAKVKETFEEEVKAAAEILRHDLTNEELLQMEDDNKKQLKAFEFEMNKLDRQGTSITKSMSRDCKELLRLFGIPYIDAPNEAEAQCAFLNAANIADGIITDDSDVWLFGANTVYKNFFLQKKIVKKYEMKDIEEKFMLDRKKLVQLAMLVGSDYTLGINGCGAVTALEIISAFPPTPEEENGTDMYQSLLSSLRKFRDWIENGRQENSAIKGLKSKIKSIEIIPGFPSANVMKAYLEPNVDQSLQPFSWGVPDEESIFEFAKLKLGWTRLKTNEILEPVLKRFKERKQKKMEDYFSIQLKKKAGASPKLSKRIQSAVGRMAGTENVEDPIDEKVKKTRKHKTNKVTSKEKKEIKAIQEAVCLLSDDEEPPEKKKSPEKFSPQKESIQKLKDEGKVNAFELLKSPEKAKPAATQKSRKRKTKDNEPSTSNSEELLPWKRPPRIPETKQIIPQREKDKKDAEENKKKAAEIFKKSKKK